MKCLYLTIVCLALFAETAPAQQPVQQIAMLNHGPLKEVSGIARSTYPGVHWVHNDSGDVARIFAITLDGDPVIPPLLISHFEDREWPGITIVNARNVDWEDIVCANGRIYIADMGNNRNKRRDLGVYVLDEPDPFVDDRTPYERFLPVRYPDQTDYPGEHWHFDCEALFVVEGKLYFLTKHRKRGELMRWEPGTKLYLLDTESTTQENVLTLVSHRSDITAVTAADVSPNGKRLAVLSYTAVWVFEKPLKDDDWLSGKASKIILEPLRVGLNEGITWQDDSMLIIVNEQRMMYRLTTSSLSNVDEP